MRSKSLYALTALVVAGIAWAWLTPIDISVTSRGIVRPEGDPIKIVSEVSGRIASLSVQEGDLVHAGDPLVQLDTHEILVKQRALKSRIHFTELRLADIQRQLDDATAIDEQSAALESLDRTTAESNLEFARARFARTDLLFHEGLVPRQTHDESRAALAQAEAEATRVKSGLKRSQSAAHLRDLEAGATPLRSDLAMLYHDLEQANLDLGRLTITSPASGQITSLAPLHSGEVLGPGAAVAAIVPITQSIVIESWLPTSDRSYVFLGQLARLKSGNHDDAFDASILSISPDARFIESNESLTGTYRILLTPSDESPALRLGMTFDVHFITRQQRLLLLLFDKLRKEIATD
jgi:multidrug resistance efflux pump